MAFQAGTDREGFKSALLKAFKSAHKAAAFGTDRSTTPGVKMPANQNNDARPNTLMKGGPQAFKVKEGYMGSHASDVLDGPSHAAPGARIRMGTSSQNVDTRRTGLMTDGHQVDRIKTPANQNVDNRRISLLPTGHQANKIKLPRNQNNDARPLRKGSGV